jgi:hypothetical protein
MPAAEFIKSFSESLAQNKFIKLSLKDYKGDDVDLKEIHIRKILIKNEEKLSFTYHYKTRDIVKNYSFAESINFAEQAFEVGFKSGTLFTLDFDLRFDGRKNKLIKSKPSNQALPSLDHNRKKNHAIESGDKSYLHDLNITDAQGNVFKNAQDKFRQINKYVEILGGLIKHLPNLSEHSESKQGGAGDSISGRYKVVDMGSGKGYLTFALYDHMANSLKLNTTITGVEYRQDMVDLCNDIAKKSNFANLQFEQGTIEEYAATNLDILIALHACDTATDDAIAKGIAANASLIVVAPCCHKQIRKEIEAHKAHNELDFLMKHGIFVERQAEMVTDGLRALFLEYYGYNTKIFEFISGEHTPKNIMIVGTKNPNAKLKDTKILEKISETKKYFGIGAHHLEKKLEI